MDARAALSPRPRGEGKALIRLYREILALRPDWDVFFYGEPAPGVQAPAGVVQRVFNLPGFRFNTWENIGLPALAHWDRIDLLHCAGSSAPRHCAGTPAVMTVHDVIPLRFNDGWPGERVLRFERQIRFGMAAAGAVIAVSEATRRDLLDLFGLPPDKVKVVHWGCDPAPAALADGASELQALGLRRPYLMAFGGGAERKNTERVMRAFAAAPAPAAEYDLVIVGAGDPAVRRRYLGMAQVLGADERIRVLDYVSDATVAALYAGAAGLLYASLYEGFGLPLLEAMSRGVPVIASDRSSIPEVAGDAALSVDPEDEGAMAQAIGRLAGDAALRRRLAAAGEQRARRFSWRRTAEQTIAIMEELACRIPHRRRSDGSLTS